MDSIQPTRSGQIEDKSARLSGGQAAYVLTRTVTLYDHERTSRNQMRLMKVDPGEAFPSFTPLSARGVERPNTKNSKPASHDLPADFSTLIKDEQIRSSIGGKGLFLHRMQQAGIPVPPFTVVDTTLIARLEQQPFPAKCLLPFLPDIDTQSQESFSLEQLRKIVTELPHPQQSEWLKGLSGFIASEDFYQQVENISAARDIRHCFFRLRQQAGEACIVRSSGVDEDRFGNAQAGRYDSRVHGGGDILQTCLQVLSSAYRPEVCPNGQVKPMALILQQCIHCQLGGVVISHSTLQDDTIQVEFAPGQPRGVVSGNTGIRPHRYRIRRSDDENSQPDRQFTAGEVTTQFVLEKIPGEAGYIEQSTSATSDAKDMMLSDEILQQLQKYIKKLENMFCCPVDIEFGVDGDQQLHVFQCRPVTQLPGSTRFSAPAPALPMAEGIMVSEGCCSSVAMEVTEPLSAEQIPPGTLLFANHASDWMLAPDILKRLGGCVFRQGGTNDHVAITLRQAGIPCLLAGSQYSEALRQSSGQRVTLVAGSFAGSPGAFLLNGDQSAFWQTHSTSSRQDIISSPATGAAEPPNFNRVDEGFDWLNRQNTRLLDYFHSDRLASFCLGPGRSKAVSMSANRSKLLKQLGIEIQQLQEDLQRFVSGYQNFLTLATASESNAIAAEVQPFIEELPSLEKQSNCLKDAIANLRSKVVIPLTTDQEVPDQSANFRQWLRDCQALLDKLQKLTQPKEVSDIQSAHDLIYWLHQRFVSALAPVAAASGQGNISEMTEDRTLINILPGGVSGLLNDNCISVLDKLMAASLRVLNMEGAAFINATLGAHVCTITMLEQAEGGKDRTLRLDISDDFSQDEENTHLQGKLKRFWFLVQILRCASIDKSSRPMAISFNQGVGKMTVEYTKVNSTSALQAGFVELVTILSGLSSMDVSINQFNRGKNTNKWYFETLVKRCQNGLDDPVNNWTFKHCLVLDAINNEKAGNHEYTFLSYLDSECRLLFEMANKAYHCIETTEEPNTNSELRQMFTAATKHLEPNDAARAIKELLLRMAIVSDSPLQDACIELLREDFDLDHNRDLLLSLVQQCQI
ncbi:PEP/pyruvate-binding domain-containing protein [Endozoicomonas sp. 2B-B]